MASRVHNTMSPEIAALLAGVFRLILQEVKTDEDKEKLAPGEVGIRHSNEVSVRDGVELTHKISRPIVGLIRMLQ